MEVGEEGDYMPITTHCKSVVLICTQPRSCPTDYHVVDCRGR